MLSGCWVTLTKLNCKHSQGKDAGGGIYRVSITLLIEDNKHGLHMVEC